MIIDTHTHLYLEEFENPSEAVRRALEAGVGHMVFPNVDFSTVKPMLDLHRAFPDVTSVAMGLHPTEVNADWEKSLADIETYMRDGTPYVAVGEIGIDLYWDKTFRNEQMKVFARQIEWADELGLPVIIHCRDGLDEVLEVIDGATAVPKGVFHSFGGTVEDIKRIRDRGDFYFGINGIVTFKNSKLRDVLPEIGLDRIVLETDSPYLAPVPHRGKRNESAYMVHTAAYVAQSLGVAMEEVADATTRNARNLFRLPA